MVEGPHVEVRQALEADIVEPLTGEGLAQGGKVGEVQLYRLARGADVGDIPPGGPNGLDMDLHGAGKGFAGAVRASEGDAHHPVEAVGGHEGQPVDLGGAVGVVRGNGGAPEAVPAVVQRTLGGRGRGEGDRGQLPARLVPAEVFEVVAAEGDGAVAVVGDGVIQALLDLDHQLAVIAEAL